MPRATPTSAPTPPAAKRRRANAAPAAAKARAVAIPEDARQRIFAAARSEFADKGLAGARTDVIAEVANSNKRMLYYYFNSKEELYLAVLEEAYIDMRRNEAQLALESLSPVDAIAKLVGFKFDYCVQNPWLIGLLQGENMLGARYLRQSNRLRELHVSLVETIDGLLKTGAKSGVFRADVDPLELYISIAALGHFFFSNRATLATAFGARLDSRAAEKRRRQHAVDVILGYLRP
jgi:AcrR family transcriptional regulator